MGYGAELEVWNTLHVEDKTKTAGSAYDLQSDGTDMFAMVSTQRDLGQTGDRIVMFTIQHTRGGYWSSQASQSLVKQQLPSDATTIYDLHKSGCEIIQYQSRALKDVLGTDGLVNVELWDSSNPDNYDFQNTTTIDFVPGYSGTKDTIGC